MSVANRQESLILIGAAIAGGCRPCLEFAVGRAWELGVEPGEIARAAELGRMAAGRARAEIDAFACETIGDFSSDVQEAPAVGGCPCSAGKAV